MTRNRRSSSLLTLRPKTAPSFVPPGEIVVVETADGPNMKRTASQTFSPYPFHQHAYVRDGEGSSSSTLDAVHEGARVVDYSPSTHSHTGSLSRAGLSIKGSCKQICRRLSTSTRRSSVPQVGSALEPPPGTAAAADAPTHPRPSPTPIAHPNSNANPRSKLRLLHQEDSGHGTATLHEGEYASAPSAPSAPKFRVFSRFGSLRGHRRPATSGPSGDFARYNPSPAPIPAQYPQYPPLPQPPQQPQQPQQPELLPAPGHAARAAAAAANNERLHRLQHQEELTAAYLDGSLRFPSAMDGVLKDNESGVGMSCTSPVVEEDEEQEQKFDPVQRLPAELMTLVLANLDAPSLIRAECVSKAWQEAASSSHVWKDVFLRRFRPEVHISPPPIMIGAAGIGKEAHGRPAPGQDWKRMYQVRMTIDRRWKGCSPSAIYLNGHTDSVYCCQFDEHKIITGSRDRTIRVWDLRTYQCIKVIGGPTHRPVASNAAELSTHQETVISNPSLNGTPLGDAIFHMPEDYHDASILCLQYDDKLMVTGSSDNTCIVWDIADDKYEPITRLEGHTAGVLDVALDDKHIVSCSKDATIMVWDRATFRPIRTLGGHRGPVNAVQLRGNLLVSASGDGVAKLWNLDSGACIKEFPSQDRGLAAVEFSDDARYVLAGGNDHVVYKFDALNGQLLHTSAKHGALVRSLFLDAHNKRVVSGSYDQSIRIADYVTGEIYGLYEDWTTSWILSAKSDYRRVVATSQDGRALILDFGWGVEGADVLMGERLYKLSARTSPGT